MDEFGIDAAWKKLFTSELSSRIQRPLVFWKNDVLIMEDENRVSCCYNLSYQEFKRKCFYAVIYMSSLVSVGGGNKVETGDYNLLKEIV